MGCRAPIYSCPVAAPPAHPEHLALSIPLSHLLAAQSGHNTTGFLHQNQPWFPHPSLMEPSTVSLGNRLLLPQVVPFLGSGLQQVQCFTHCCGETPGQINPTLCHHRAPLPPTPVPFKCHLVSFGFCPQDKFSLGCLSTPREVLVLRSPHCWELQSCPQQAVSWQGATAPRPWGGGCGGAW